MHIKIKKGLNIPIGGKPTGDIQELVPSGQTADISKPKEISLNLWPFEDLRLKLLKKVGQKVKIGEAICEDKGCPGRMFVAPAAGTIKDVRRGLKRRIMDIIIEVDENEEYLEYLPTNPEGATRHDIISKLMEGGLFTVIRQRPFSILANPQRLPRSIFVKAIESAPFVPPPELQIQGHEKEFQSGLNALAKLSEGSVHLIYHKDSICKAFTEAENVTKHTAEGPHPIATHSVFIEKIDPIRSPEDVIWTLNAHDVICIGKLLTKGRYYNERVISIAGPGIIEGQRGYYRVREGCPIASLVAGRIPKSPQRLVSGDPLMGTRVDMEEFLGFYHYTFCAIPENTERELLHFFRLGSKKFSFSRAYASGHMDSTKKVYDFTTSQHGEHRAFIDPTLYDEVMPLNIPTMQLVKSVMAEDYELADELGLLSVDAEDFALPTFVCPSKMEMTEIMKQGIRAHAAEMLE
ncbi:MAG: Na(+)-translocating NADH-quinone reductase subunit A [Chlamydiota bacterium]|nr:Na(+)-translocating NADH-quinone reductase subunit A [Chlamydiota bacterium]